MVINAVGGSQYLWYRKCAVCRLEGGDQSRSSNNHGKVERPVTCRQILRTYIIPEGKQIGHIEVFQDVS
ncbi:MAG: hypothetical protein R2741_11785 [Methanolobus sp.]